MRYAELHCHSNYSFQEGASSLEELLARAAELGYPSLALTDHDNLCGAMEFSRIANDVGVHPVTGAEITLNDGSHLTLLARTRQGYSNICNLITDSRMGIDGDRRTPRLAPEFLEGRGEGVILMTGCSKGRVPALAAEGRIEEAEAQLRSYLERFGAENVFVELQQNLVHGDTVRNRRLVRMARRLGAGIVATNNVHYHVPERHRLQDALVAIRHNQTLDATHRERRANSHFYLKSADQMAELFRETPDAIRNTLLIAERCEFNLKENLGYTFPGHDVPPGHTPLSYLREICEQAAVRKYGSITPRIQERLDGEFRLIQMHDLAGFFLTYYDVIRIAHEVMIDLGMTDPEIPIEERPPGRGRGSSVAMLVGYLIGLSHIDPLEYELSLERFMNEEMDDPPDIDIDFPREIREKLIIRVHEHYGWQRAVMTGAISTYRLKGCIRDLGKVLGLPSEDIDKLSKRVDDRHASSLASEIASLPDFKHVVDAPVWRKLMDLAAQLEGFPKYLAQHSGGMIISSTPLTDMVPVQPSAIDGRFICHWDKDSIGDARFVKIDFLALGALSQMQEALQMVEQRTGRSIDLSRIDFESEDVYRSIHEADTIGIFQIESAAQMQTVTRLKPQSLQEMAYEVAAVRPGVGVNEGVTQFIERYRYGAEWDYDHESERPALERTLGIILFQDQVNELAVSVAGFSYKEADNLRRTFSRKNNTRLLGVYFQRFMEGAMARGVPEDAARTVFRKFSGQYMFPESHAYAFGITAYQMSWLKYTYPLEFFAAIFNQQPMGFYNLETLKEDAKRHGISVLHPDINRSMPKCSIRDDSSFWTGFLHVKGVGQSNAEAIVEAREKGGHFRSLPDAMTRTGLQRDAIENLVIAGAFDSMVRDRRSALWEVGLLYQPVGVQSALPMPVKQDMAQLPEMTPRETMAAEYETMGIHPDGHFMEYMRPDLPRYVVPSEEVHGLDDETQVVVAGLVVRRQHPQASAIFLTLEDETGHAPIVLWPQVFERYRLVVREPVLMVWGFVSRRHGTMNIVATHIEGVQVPHALPDARSWR